MTVRELMMAQLPDLLPRGQVVVGTQFVAALRDIGLWDAEVQEGTLAEGNQLDEEGAMWVNVWVASAGRIGRLGDSVRVIVLPVEEK